MCKSAHISLSDFIILHIIISWALITSLNALPGVFQDSVTIGLLGLKMSCSLTLADDLIMY